MLLWFGLALAGSSTIWYGSQHTPSPSNAQVTFTASRPNVDGIVARAIKDVEVGDRTVGTNPLREQVEEGISEPDAKTWRKLKLRMVKQSGLPLWIDLLRPLEWIEEVGATPGGTIFLDLPEMGAVGDAEVTYLGPCPPIKPRPGTVVTGKFVHESDGGNVVELRLEGESKPTRVTDTHAYWSEDRQDFVPVGEIRPGERLDTLAGIRRVVSITPVEYEGVLYNLETHGEHVYRAGRLGTLVHNTCTTVYRVIRADESIEAGLVAKNPLANYTVEGHIINGSRKGFRSQYISTTTKLSVARDWAARDGCRIIQIDVTKLAGNTVTDLSTDAGRAAHLRGVSSKAFARSSSEVLIEGFIPPDAIQIVH